MIERDTMLFRWRKMDDAPRDGTAFVHLRFLTYCGGDERPCDLDPDLNLLRRVHLTSTFDRRGAICTQEPGDGPEGGYWSEARYDHSVCGRGCGRVLDAPA